MALLWRLKRAGPDAGAAEESSAERRALYVVAATLLLAAFITVEAVGALAQGDSPESSAVGVALAAVSLALEADAVETWVCAYLSLALLAGVGLYAAFGWEWTDAVGALAMLPVILWQGWETFEEARDG